MRIQHNIAAMNSYANYATNVASVNKNLEKLSSGYKINRAGDDAAGLAISEKMRAQITGLEAASKNVKDGISLVKTAEGAMQEIQDMLNRMDYLATQSANGTYDNEVDRANLQKEVESLKSEINRIADSANFNGIKLLDGSLAGESQAKNVPMDASVAVKGIYTTADAAATAALTDLTTDDIGKTLDYTVTWLDANGAEQTTTVSLTYKGDGTGIDNSAVTKNYFEDVTGQKYYLDATGKIAQATIQDALVASLKADDTFSSQFDIAESGNGIKMTAKFDGSAGAQIVGIGISSNFTTISQPWTNSVAGPVTLSKEPLDSMQKFAGGSLQVAVSGDDLDDATAKIFEIDGKKFLLNAGAGAGLDADQLKALGDDVTVIALKGSTYAAADDAEKVAAEISRVTGLEVKGYKTAPDHTADSGIAAGDIVFTKDHLNLQGKTLKLQIGDTADSFNIMGVKIGDMHTRALGINEIDVGNQDGAAAAIEKIKAAINAVSSVRGDLGAIQNRLDHTANNLSVMTENIQDAESTIRDTDVAEEMMSYTKNNILVQSAQAMLAQANQIPQGVLQLLG